MLRCLKGGGGYVDAQCSSCKRIAIFDGNWAKNVALVTKKVKRLFSKAKQSFWDFQWLLLVRWSAKHRNEEFFWWTEGEPKKLLISVRSTSQNQQKSLGNLKKTVELLKTGVELEFGTKVRRLRQKFLSKLCFPMQF